MLYNVEWFQVFSASQILEAIFTPFILPNLNSLLLSAFSINEEIVYWNTCSKFDSWKEVSEK